MLCADVNLLLDLANHGTRRHEAVRRWWAAALRSPESLLVPDFVAASFVRVVTDRRILASPLGIDDAFAFLDHVIDSPHVVLLPGSAASWARFRALAMSLGMTGNDVPDAHLAALALHMDAAVVTGDRGFHRFPGLRVIDPAA